MPCPSVSLRGSGRKHQDCQYCKVRMRKRHLLGCKYVSGKRKNVDGHAYYVLQWHTMLSLAYYLPTTEDR